MRPTRRALVGVLAAIALLATGVQLALAATVGTADVPSPAADHVDPSTCDAITADSAGTIFVNGVALTDADLALLDAQTLASLILAANVSSAQTAAAADSCVDVVIDPGFVTVNADVLVCGAPVAINADGTATVADVLIPSVLVDADAQLVLGLAIDAPDPDDVQSSCFTVTVIDDDVQSAVTRPMATIVMCAMVTHANGNATINGTFVDADQLTDAAPEHDPRTETETGVRVTSGVELEIDAEAVIGIEVLLFHLDGCSPPIVPRYPLVIVVHNCPNVSTEAEFAAVEARAATNPTTPKAPLGALSEAVLECPTVRLAGDALTVDAIGGGTSTFDFRVWGGAGESYRLSTQADYEGGGVLRETEAQYDLDRDGLLEATPYYELSGYSLTPTKGIVTIRESVLPDGYRFGTARLHSHLGFDQQFVGTIVSAAEGEIVIDATKDFGTGAYLEVYNFVGALPDTAMTDQASEPRCLDGER